MSFNFIFSNGNVAKESYLNATIYQYNQIRYGFKSFLWNNRDKKAIFSYYKNNGLLSQFQYTTVNRRNHKGEYHYDGSEMDWNSYNQSIWKEFNQDFDEKTKLPESVKTIKEVIEHKNQLLLHFLENHAETIQLEFKAQPLSRKKPLVTENGIKIILLAHNHEITQFEIKSPSNTLSLMIYLPKNGKKPYSELINHRQNSPQILFPEHAHQLMQKFFEYAEIIVKKPLDVINNPYYHLNLDVNLQVKLQSAQEFLIQKNQERFDNHKNNQNSPENRQKSLVHENLAKPQPSDRYLNQTIKKENETTELIEKNKPIDFTTNQPTYTDEVIVSTYYSEINQVWFYGVKGHQLIEWLNSINEQEEWVKQEKIFILNNEIEDNLDPISEIKDVEKAFTLNGLKFNPLEETLFIEESNYQIFKSLYKPQAKSERPQAKFDVITKYYSLEMKSWLYTVDTIKFLEWLHKEDELFNWIDDQRIFVVYQDNLDICESIEYNPEYLERIELWTQQGTYLINEEINIYIEEPDYEIYLNQ